MKKNLIVLLAALLLLLSACGPAPSAPDASDAPDAPVQDQPGDSPGAPSPFDPTAAIEETVLVDESDIRITATELACTVYEAKLSLTIENNSAEDLSFTSGTMGYSCNSVNGYMVDSGYLNADVTAGKKANESISFSSDELTLLGIRDIAEMELGFCVTDSGYDDYLITGPRQLKTSLAGTLSQEEDTYRKAVTDRVLDGALGLTVEFDSGETVYDQRGIRVLSQTLITNRSDETVLLAEVENGSGDAVYISVGEIALNGLTVQSGTWSTDCVSPGKRRVLSMNLGSMLDDAARTAFGLEQAGRISYTIEPKDPDGDTLAVPQTLTLTVPGGSVSCDDSGEELFREGGLRIVSKGLAADDLDYSDDIHLLLLVENGTNQELSFGIAYDSVSVNGYMTDFLCYSVTAAPGGSGMLDVKLMGYALEENGISGLEEITEAELMVEVRDDNYKTVAKPIVTVRGG